MLFPLGGDGGAGELVLVDVGGLEGGGKEEAHAEQRSSGEILQDGGFVWHDLMNGEIYEVSLMGRAEARGPKLVIFWVMGEILGCSFRRARRSLPTG